MTHSARRYEALCASVSLSPTPTLSAAEEALRLRLAAYLDTTVPGLIGRNRTPAVSRRRRLAMWLLRHQGHSLKAIGRILERDHSTVIHGLRLVQRDRTNNPAFAQTLRTLEGGWR
jgi:chromosomal replication initiation ATPase DnaA